MSKDIQKTRRQNEILDVVTQAYAQKVKNEGWTKEQVVADLIEPGGQKPAAAEALARIVMNRVNYPVSYRNLTGVTVLLKFADGQKVEVEPEEMVFAHENPVKIKYVGFSGWRKF